MPGTCAAGVGKHAAKLAYEHARRVCVSAEWKSVRKAVARGPGVVGMGGGGAGEGLREGRGNMLGWWAWWVEVRVGWREEGGEW